MKWTQNYPVYITWYMSNGRVLEVCDYGLDVGNLHVIDYYLHLEVMKAKADAIAFGTGYLHNGIRIDPREIKIIFCEPATDDWTRYDGDLL